jgi:hypothetical protein
MYVRTLSLFTEPRPSSQGPSAIVVSLLVHGAVLGLLSFGFMHTPRIDEQALSKRYAVRRLDLHTSEPQMRPSAGSGVRACLRSLYPTWRETADSYLQPELPGSNQEGWFREKRTRVTSL